MHQQTNPHLYGTKTFPAAAGVPAAGGGSFFSGLYRCGPTNQLPAPSEQPLWRGGATAMSGGGATVATVASPTQNKNRAGETKKRMKNATSLDAVFSFSFVCMCVRKLRNSMKSPHKINGGWEQKHMLESYVQQHTFVFFTNNQTLQHSIFHSSSTGRPARTVMLGATVTLVLIQATGRAAADRAASGV